jgi:hypothetical protein
LFGTAPTEVAQLESENKFTVPAEQVVDTVHPVQREQFNIMSSSTWYATRVNGAGQVRFPLLMMQAENPAGAAPLQTASLFGGGTSQ